MSIEQLISVLQANRLMRSRTEVVAFDEALVALADQPKDKVEKQLPELFLIFDDACKQPDVMWGLLHFIEEFDVGSTIRAYSTVVPTLRKHAPEWMEIIMYRVLNHPADREALRVLLPSLPESDKLALRQVLENIRLQEEETQGLADKVAM